jgi:hypothetical protein
MRKLLFLLPFVLHGVLFCQHLEPDSVSGIGVPVPDSIFVSCSISVFLPKTQVWADRYVYGSAIPPDFKIRMTSQGAGTIFVFDQCFIQVPGGSKQPAKSRSLVLGTNGMFTEIPPRKLR